MSARHTGLVPVITPLVDHVKMVGAFTADVITVKLAKRGGALPPPLAQTLNFGDRTYFSLHNSMRQPRLWSGL